MSFKDHFSHASAEYAAFRPRYPEALFDALAALAPGRGVAWDCATGSGQAATALAERFRRVVATDASPEQVAAATPREGVAYRVAPAEASGLPDASVELVTVAQALHWFDLDAFYREVRRVLAPGGVLAAWCYGRMRIDPAVDPLLERFYAVTVGPYWPPERALIEAGYAGLRFPFEEVPLPAFRMERELTLPGLLGYLGTWSAVRRYRQARGSDPLAPLAAELAACWGDPERARRAEWPLSVRAGCACAPGRNAPQPG